MPSAPTTLAKGACCPLCGGPMAKVIYFGLPGRLCLDPSCTCLDGLASWAPPIASTGPDGEPAFAFFIYAGSYWSALWRWLIKGE